MSSRDPQRAGLVLTSSKLCGLWQLERAAADRDSPAVLLQLSSTTVCEGPEASAEPPMSAGLSEAPQLGLQVVASRHGMRVKRLGRPADQRRALVRSLTTQVLDKGKIRTTAVRCWAALMSLRLRLEG